MEDDHTEDLLMIDTSDPRWQELIDFDARLYRKKQLRLLTPEARVLLRLMMGGSLRVNEAMEVAATSYKGFYAVLERLKKAGLVSLTKDEKDHRARNLTIER
ncbi:helix-turn-helix domain-containing protein [Sphingobium sp. DC-2]|uniref:MarR family transcriptional regulator n=1 Tax=Sphingobium sp. DC-2 TaxID=1303256 RepID=UPI0004C3948B|nr:helix-turn-helix domain-containing protein [Sphingobium sp. DC-2]